MDLRALPTADTLADGLDRFASSCVAFDGTSPFNDASMLALHRRHALTAHNEHGDLTALALISADHEDVDEIEFAVAPAWRRQGIGAAMHSKLAAGNRPQQFWAHGDTPGARALAAAVGAIPKRTLYVFARPVRDTDVNETEHDMTGAHIRTFDADRDADAWVACNAHVFADHPEQGQLTRADLAARMQQPWFRADTFFLAVSNDAHERLLGYCWCKCTPEAAEIYVLGVEPDASGRGIGRALMGTAFAKIAELGYRESILYVDGSNERAMSLYQASGYTERFRDVLYV